MVGRHGWVKKESSWAVSFEDSRIQTWGFSFLPEVGEWERLKKRRVERSDDKGVWQFCLGFFLLLGEWKGQSIRVLTQICSGLENYFPSWILTGHADLCRVSKLDTFRQKVLIFTCYVHPCKPNCISQYFLPESSQTVAGPECGEPWTCLYNEFEKLPWCRVLGRLVIPKVCPTLDTHIFWSRTSKKL